MKKPCDMKFDIMKFKAVFLSGYKISDKIRGKRYGMAL